MHEVLSSESGKVVRVRNGVLSTLYAVGTRETSDGGFEGSTEKKVLPARRGISAHTFLPRQTMSVYALSNRNDGIDAKSTEVARTRTSTPHSTPHFFATPY